MKSIVFSMLKIATAAMLVVWALQPTAVRASGNGACTSACSNEMNGCVNQCAILAQYGGGGGFMACVNSCAASLYSCLNSCGGN